MTILTLEVSDELAKAIRPIQHRLPELLSFALNLSSRDLLLAVSGTRGEHVAFYEMIDFLASGPNPEQIRTFKISPETQDRLDELLDKNREATLSEVEKAELEVFQQINNIFILLVTVQSRVEVGRKKGVRGGVHPHAHLFFGNYQALA